MPKIITVFNQKGGCGKTTVTMNLAGSFGLSKKVLIVDLDAQGTSTMWHQQAEGNFPADILQAGVGEGEVIGALEKVANDYDYIIIDCPPSVENLGCTQALLVSDMVLVPSIPSPTDIWAAKAAIALAQEAKKKNSGLIIYILPTMVKSNSKLATDMVDCLADLDVPLTRTSIGDRTAYKDAALFGSTVLNSMVSGRKAAQEITSLNKEVTRILGRK